MTDFEAGISAQKEHEPFCGGVHIPSTMKKGHKNLSRQAKKMKHTSEFSHPPVEVGDNDAISIPGVDRAKAGFRYVIGVCWKKC